MDININYHENAHIANLDDDNTVPLKKDWGGGNFTEYQVLGYFINPVTLERSTFMRIVEIRSDGSERQAGTPRIAHKPAGSIEDMKGTTWIKKHKASLINAIFEKEIGIKKDGLTPVPYDTGIEFDKPLTALLSGKPALADHGGRVWESKKDGNKALVPPTTPDVKEDANWIELEKEPLNADGTVKAEFI